MSDVFILGGKTRLARALFLESSRSGRTALILNTSAADLAILREHYPEEAIVSNLGRASAPKITIVVCAFGLVHPTVPNPHAHMGAFLADSRFLSTLVAGHQGQIHLVVVSSVVALVPMRDRAYYAGFKNVAESVAAAAVVGRPDSTFSVLYPGRLVDRRNGGGLAQRLATPYASLSRRLLGMARSNQPTTRVVGWDARLWLLATLSRVFVGALRPNLPVTLLPARDVPSRLVS